jgi:hypothetical protein
MRNIVTLNPVEALYVVHCNLDMLVDFGVGSSDCCDCQAIQGGALSAQPHQAEMQGKLGFTWCVAICLADTASHATSWIREVYTSRQATRLWEVCTNRRR